MSRKGSIHYAWVICGAGLWLFLCISWVPLSQASFMARAVFTPCLC